VDFHIRESPASTVTAKFLKTADANPPERTISPKEADAVQVRLSGVERAGAFNLGFAWIAKLA
jgi:hypothetical protein